jgi:hypothetical protein
MNTPVSEDQLVSELWARDVRFILGSKPDHPPTLPPDRLITALAESRESRLQLSLIPLFLSYPEFAAYTKTVAKKLNPAPQLILKCFYSAAVWLEQKHLSQNKLPDLFSKELELSPDSNPEENLGRLAKRQQELSGSHINWLGTYQHAADIWLKELELHRHNHG